MLLNRRSSPSDTQALAVSAADPAQARGNSSNADASTVAHPANR